MAFEFKLPDIGEGVHEGEIVQWLVKPGDSVAEDQPLVEVMTDKVTAEIPSPVSGVLKECRGNAGDVIQVGHVIAVLEKTGGNGKTTPPDKSQAHPVNPKTKEVAASGSTTTTDTAKVSQPAAAVCIRYRSYPAGNRAASDRWRTGRAAGESPCRRPALALFPRRHGPPILAARRPAARPR